MTAPAEAAAEPRVEPASKGVSSPLLRCLVIAARPHGMFLTEPQLVQDNSLPGGVVSPADLMRCAVRAGLKARKVTLGAADLAGLRKALPAIVLLANGSGMVLVGYDDAQGDPCVHLRDPNADDSLLLTLDLPAFERAWSGEAILIRRNHELTDEEQPFSLGLIAAVMLRERRLVRDLCISAFILSLFALAPILFWRILSDKVVYYSATNTFVVVCLAMATVTVFEAVFGYLRQFLLTVITTKVDARLSEYMFDKVLRLPIDFFERTQVGTIGHDMNEFYKIRTFLTGQLFGTLLDSMTLLIFLPVMFYFSPLLTFIVLAFCALIVIWLIAMLPLVRRVTGAVIAAESARGAFLYQTLAGMRTVKSLALETRQRNGWDVHVAKTSRLHQRAGFIMATIQAVVRPLERLAVNGSFAVGVYLSITTHDPVYVGAMFAFLMLSQRVSGPLMQMAQLVNQYDEARAAVGVVGALVNRPKEEGSSEHGVRTPLSRTCRIRQSAFQIPRRDPVRVRRRQLRCADGIDARHRRAQRLRQDHRHPPAATPSLRLRGPDQDRRRRRARIRHHASPAQPRRRAAGELPVQRHDPRKHRRGQAARHFRRGRARCAPRRRRGIHRSPPARLRNLHLRGLAQPFRRPAPAARDRARAHRRSRASSSSTRPPARSIPKARRSSTRTSGASPRGAR